jgi:competence protein ComEC
MNFWKYILGFSALASIVVWIAVVNYPNENLHIITCDVGQGDAILATYKNIQILTDGGPANNKVIGCLSKHMPFWDREIEIVILTHPQADHFGGLAEVFRRFKVKNFVGEQVDASNQEYQVLKSLVGGSGARVIVPKTGMKIRYDLIYLDIIWPQEGLTSSELNDYSVVYILRYGDFEALLTGDIGPEISNEIVKVLALSDIRRVNYLKVPHHGSKNGLTKELLDAAEPKVAVISVGKNNSYGHPHEETLKILRDRGIKILRTDEKGNVEISTDGKKWSLQF